jgi:putative DNA primase/helicase
MYAQSSGKYPSDTFDIRNFVDRLTPAGSKERFQCPSCGENKLTIDLKSGKYHCWGECECSDVREAISPWNELTCGRSSNRTPRTPSSQKPRPFLLDAIPVPGDAVLVKLSQKATDEKPPQKPNFIPARVKELVSKAQQKSDTQVKSVDAGNGFVEYIPQPQVSLFDTITETIYSYSDSQWVHRFDWSDPSKAKGRDKTFMQCHLAADGTKQWKKGEALWSAYKLEEAITAAKNTQGTPALLWQEGEKCVKIARSHAIASLTFQGSNWRPEEIKPVLINIKEALNLAVMVFLHDPDKTGLKKAEIFKKCCLEVGLPCVLINPHKICDNLPHDAGDIEEILTQMNAEEFIRKLEDEIHTTVNWRKEFDRLVPNPSEFFDSVPDRFETNVEFVQRALEMLYGDKPWICFSGKLCGWDGNYYEHVPDVVHLRRISDFCNSYPVKRKGKIRFPYADPGVVNKVLRWVKIRFGVRPELLNPAGINCTNGVLQVHWDSDVPSFKLIDHTPDLYYTYKPVATYDPKADPRHCDRLLEALDPAERKIFLRTIAASLDLPTVRKYKGRMIRALLLKGDGSNGKDSLREVVSMMYGRQGMTSCTLTDFAAYDSGRKFSVAKLLTSRVNWSSENANITRLDQIQSLKAFITGDILESERKGLDGEDYNPTGIAIFNVNDTPNMQGTLEAIASRYGILSFVKTFKINADPSKGEIEADPRFKYDPMFLAGSVVPAFLNRVLEALVDMMHEGIDYSCIAQTLENIQAENCHLFQFCQDVGLSYDPNSTLTASSIWTALEGWYRDNGTLDYEEGSNGKLKSIWVEQVNKNDKNVKAANQVIPRFLQLFPKAKKVTIPHPSGKKTILAIQGIGFSPNKSPGTPTEVDSLVPGNVSTPMTTTSTPVTPQEPPQQNLVNQELHPNHCNLTAISEKNNSQLPDINSSINTEPEVSENHSETNQQPDEEVNKNKTPKNEGEKLGEERCNDQSTGTPGVETGVGFGVAGNQNGVRTTQLSGETPTITKGTRVRIRPNTLGPARNGKEGVVLRVKTLVDSGVQYMQYVVLLLDESLKADLRQVDCCANWLEVLETS